jgi:ABC-type multidrug transport system ATPase subunit
MSRPVSFQLNSAVFFGDLLSPLDYLDRESLAALIEALKVFEGGVLVITHNRDFSESLCKEVWAMRDGRLEASGHNWVEGQGSGPRIDKNDGEEDVQYDAMGNKIDNKKMKKLTSAEQRKVRLLCSPSVFFRQLTLLFPIAQEGAHGTEEERRGGH